MLSKDKLKLSKVVNPRGKTIDTFTPTVVETRREVIQAFLPPALRGLKITDERDLEEMREEASYFDLEGEIERAKKERLYKK